MPRVRPVARKGEWKDLLRVLTVLPLVLFLFLATAHSEGLLTPPWDGGVCCHAPDGNCFSLASPTLHSLVPRIGLLAPKGAWEVSSLFPEALERPPRLVPIHS